MKFENNQVVSFTCSDVGSELIEVEAKVIRPLTKEEADAGIIMYLIEIKDVNNKAIEYHAFEDELKIKEV